MNFRVLHVLDHSIPAHSGYAFRTLAILREQRALGWETFQLTSPKHPDSAYNEERIDGWHFYRTNLGDNWTKHLPVVKELRLINATSSRLMDIVAKTRPQIIHAHSPALNAIPVLRAGRRFGIPTVYEVRAFWEDAAVDHGTSKEWGLRYRLTRAMETYALRNVDHVTTICEGLKNDILSRGIPSRKVTVIPNAVDVESFEYCADADAFLRDKLNLRDALVLGFVGSFYGYEGLDLLLDATARLMRTHPNLRVLLVGGGPQESALKRRATALGLSQNVIFVGRVPNSEVQKYYNLIDILIYARHAMRLTELVTPLKPLEAMAQGKLLIASNVGGHRELIQEGVTGYLFPPGNAAALAEKISMVLQEKYSWDTVRKAGRKLVEDERNWRSSVARYEAVYERLCTANPLHTQ